MVDVRDVQVHHQRRAVLDLRQLLRRRERLGQRLGQALDNHLGHIRRLVHLDPDLALLWLGLRLRLGRGLGRDLQLRADIGQVVVVARRQRAPEDVVLADRLALGAGQRAAQAVAFRQPLGPVGQRRVGLALGLALCVGGQGQRRLQYDEVHRLAATGLIIRRLRHVGPHVPAPRVRRHALAVSPLRRVAVGIGHFAVSRIPGHGRRVGRLAVGPARQADRGRDGGLRDVRRHAGGRRVVVVRVAPDVIPHAVVPGIRALGNIRGELVRGGRGLVVRAQRVQHLAVVRRSGIHQRLRLSVIGQGIRGARGRGADRHDQLHGVAVEVVVVRCLRLEPDLVGPGLRALGDSFAVVRAVRAVHQPAALARCAGNHQRLRLLVTGQGLRRGKGCDRSLCLADGRRHTVRPGIIMIRVANGFVPDIVGSGVGFCRDGCVPAVCRRGGRVCAEGVLHRSAGCCALSYKLLRLSVVGQRVRGRSFRDFCQRFLRIGISVGCVLFDRCFRARRHIPAACHEGVILRLVADRRNLVLRQLQILVREAENQHGFSIRSIIVPGADNYLERHFSGFTRELSLQIIQFLS